MNKEKMNEIQLAPDEAELIENFDLTGTAEMLLCNDGTTVECEALAVAFNEYMRGSCFVYEQIIEGEHDEVVILNPDSNEITFTNKTEIEIGYTAVASLFRKLYPLTYSKLHGNK